MTHDVLVTRFKAALASRSRPAVNASVQDLVDAQATLGKEWRSIAEVAVHNGEVALARTAIGLFVSQLGGVASARFHQAAVLARTGDPRAARDILLRLPASVPDSLSHAYTLGMTELNLGNIEAARDALLRAVAIDPRSGQSWMALAMTGRLGGSDDIADQILAAAPALGASPPLERAQYLYARGKVLDERDDIDGAFAAFASGAALARTVQPYDRAADTSSASMAIDGYDAAAIRRVAARVSIDTSRAIIVTGAPRSGSTLVEQILASHSAVADGGEIGRFGLVAREVGGTSGIALQQWLDKGASPDVASRLYLHLIEQRFGPTGRVVDKTLDASRYLGLLTSVMPDAPIIWMRRDPLDQAWSCFRNWFAGVGTAWSNDLQDIAHHLTLERELLTTWQGILGPRLLVIDYADLANDPGPITEQIMRHCGLAMESSIFTPHLTQRAVATASVTQVREPISNRAVGSADRYRKHLQPFIDAYR